jgi:glycosyltransferase involved in cell wall biosynthesis
MTQIRVAVLLPCFNEEDAVGLTVASFRAALPDAAIYVFDNNSTDNTKKVASATGATVRTENMRGKGNVVRRMFADIDADVYVLADGDATYDASAAPAMINLLLAEGLDMVVGTRKGESHAAYRRGHVFGNLLLTSVLSTIFGHSFTDILSGYRIFSRRFVKCFPALSKGFEIETEMSVHALELRMPTAEYVTTYKPRLEGSISKLATYRDGWRILFTIINLFRIERPIVFFGCISAILSILSIAIAIPLAITYAETGLVPRIPTAILSTGLAILACLSLSCGIILDTVVHGRREVRRLAYLSLPHPDSVASRPFEG